MKHPIVLWVEALESGEYEQTQLHLREENCFCCLGVANDLYRKMTGKGEWIPHSLGFAFRISPSDSSSVGLASSVKKWLELKTNGEFGPDKLIEEDYCINLNDSKGADFHEIAAFLRETHPELFPEKYSNQVEESGL